MSHEWLKEVDTIGEPHTGGRASVSPLPRSLAVKPDVSYADSAGALEDSLLSLVRATPSQKVMEPSPPPVQNVPWILWKVIALIAKTFCDPDEAGAPMLPAGMSTRWHLNEKLFLDCEQLQRGSRDSLVVRGVCVLEPNSSLDRADGVSILAGNSSGEAGDDACLPLQW